MQGHFKAYLRFKENAGSLQTVYSKFRSFPCSSYVTKDWPRRRGTWRERSKQFLLRDGRAEYSEQFRLQTGITNSIPRDMYYSVNAGYIYFWSTFPEQSPDTHLALLWIGRDRIRTAASEEVARNYCRTDSTEPNTVSPWLLDSSFGKLMYFF